MTPEFENIYNELSPGIFRYLRRLLNSPLHAEDLLQEAFMKLHIQLASGATIENVRAWLYRVATNLVRDKHRSELRSQVKEHLWVHHENVVDFDSRLEDQQRVHRVLKDLSPRMRQVLLLFSEGFSYREISDVAGVEMTYVGVLLQRARSSFRQSYEEQHEKEYGIRRQLRRVQG